MIRPERNGERLADIFFSIYTVYIYICSYFVLTQSSDHLNNFISQHTCAFRFLLIGFGAMTALQPWFSFLIQRCLTDVPLSGKNKPRAALLSRTLALQFSRDLKPCLKSPVCCPNVWVMLSVWSRRRRSSIAGTLGFGLGL